MEKGECCVIIIINTYIHCIYVMENRMIIDTARLSRDYNKEPLVKGKSSRYGSIKGEIPTYNDIFYLYIECNLNIHELGEYFNRKRDSALLWVKHYNICKSRELIESKMACTKVVRYGDATYNNSIASQDTKFNKYGKRGNGDGMRLFFLNATEEEKNDVVAKRRETCLKKYGYDNHMKNPEFLANFLKGISGRRSKPELQLESWFITNEIECVPQFVIEHSGRVKVYDFFLPKFNTLIEFDGGFWHRLTEQIENDKLKNQIAKDLGIKLVRIKGSENIDVYWEIQ